MKPSTTTTTPMPLPTAGTSGSMPLRHSRVTASTYSSLPAPDLLVARRIVDAVSAAFQVPVAEILGKRRFRSIAHARHAAVYLARKRIGWSYPQLGGYFHHADHTSSMHSVRFAERALRYARDPKLNAAATWFDHDFCARIDAITTLLDATAPDATATASASTTSPITP